MLEETDRYSPIGLALYDGVIAGPRLASSLTSVSATRVDRPVVVTLATCESGRQADVRTSDASLAHDLHDQGIPLVVAFQSPLSVDGSVPFVDCFYQGQLWGENPLVTMYEARLKLNAAVGQEAHDWASLVVYEAFPSDFASQLEEVRYWQARRAQERALVRLEALVSGISETSPASARQERHAELVAKVEAISERLPKSGPYELECSGLRAAGSKRLAQAAFQLAVAPGAQEPWRATLLSECAFRLDEARTEYWRATKSFLGQSSEPTRKKANLHWLLGQVLSLDVVLGRGLDSDFWSMARVAAKIDSENGNEVDRAWAHVSLSELALLRLADASLPDVERARLAEEALVNTDRFVDLLGRSSEHVMTTRRQIERYINWWGNPDFAWALEMLGVSDREHWRCECGLLPTAKHLVERLRGPQRSANGPKQNSGGAEAPRAKASPGTGDGQTGARTGPERTPSHLAKRREPAAIFDVDMLPAENGDCLWIEYGNPLKPRRILIDCGAASAAQTVGDRITALGEPANRTFELFVLTHIDADHINGVLPLFENQTLDARFEDIWFNGWRQVNSLVSWKMVRTTA